MPFKVCSDVRTTRAMKSKCGKMLAGELYDARSIGRLLKPAIERESCAACSMSHQNRRYESLTLPMVLSAYGFQECAMADKPGIPNYLPIFINTLEKRGVGGRRH